MQVPKDEVRDRILLSATDEFFEHGYKNASLRAIADKAEITIGNIYSYFKNKEDLFGNIMENIISSLEIFISGVFKDEIGENISIHKISDLICDIFIDNKKAFLIIISGSEGTSFDKVKFQIAKWIQVRLSADYLPQIQEGTASDELSEGLSWSILEGIVKIMQSCFDDPEKMRLTVRELLEIIIGSSLRQDNKEVI